MELINRLFAKGEKKESPLAGMLREWCELKARCEVEGDPNIYAELRDARKDAADKAVQEFLRQMDTGHMVVPDTESLLGVLNESKGRCCE